VKNSGTGAVKCGHSGDQTRPSASN
jgi:hypothetical protein